MPHSKSLDGIRAIAVMMVMLFHFGYLAAGWAGVQAFFVLSGYLITNILLQGKDASIGHYLGVFFWHRALRILPLLCVFFLAVWLAYAVYGVPESFGADWPWLISSTANLARIRTTDLGPAFVHLWSLAVEQQFYLVWPLLVFFLSATGFRLVVAGLLLLTPVLRLLIFNHLLHVRSDVYFAGQGVYVLPFSQFDAFAAGAAIPLWRLDKLRNAGWWFVGGWGLLGSAGFAVLLSQYFGFGAFIGSWGYPMYLVGNYGYVWGYSLLNLCSMLAIICALQRVGPMRLLESRPLVWIGKISYGIYVYHVPLLMIGIAWMERWNLEMRGLNQVLLFFGWFTVVMIISTVSFRCIEKPFLRLKNYWWEPLNPLQTAA